MTVTDRAVDPIKDVLNQPPPLEPFNAFESNTPLQEAAKREGADWATTKLIELGAEAGDPHIRELGRLANENPPVLKTHDRYGNRIDEVEFHPSWHELMKHAVGHGFHALPWREPGPGAHVARGAMTLTMSGVESGTGCPISMTYAVVPALRKQPEIAAEWEPRILSLEYDGELKPVTEKPGAIFGMAMTERQGGSDVRANITTAEPLNGGGAGAEYRITGHKWFCSAPMSDAFLVLAQTESGVSCFLMPRFTPDGERNAFHINRLKDKLGNKSNASSEVEFHGAWARMVGEEGRGVPTIIEMVNHTRLDCVLASAGLMRAALEQAIHHTAQRSAFGKTLIDQPLMQNVLADLALDSEAATITAMRLARAYDEAVAGDETANLFKRLATAVSKYWICKSATWQVGEALECLGGNGYVEESGMPRLYREVPLLSIWEGSGNVNALDVLRAMAKQPDSLHVFIDEIGGAVGADARLDAHIAAIKKELSSFDDIEFRARRIVEMMALGLQGSLVVKHSPPEVADAFCATRLEGGNRGRSYGTLPAGTDATAIVARHRP
jgi:putative acyl-CoA dehydrogenase